MKKFFSVLLCALMILSLAACGRRPVPEAEVTSETQLPPEVFSVGICNYADTASMDQIVDNIRSRLKEIEKEENVIFDVVYKSCKGNANAAAQNIKELEASGVQLMVAVGTPVAEAMRDATAKSQLPVVFAAASDPIASDLVDSIEVPGGNITGTTDFLDTSGMLDLIFAADPNAARIGLLYDATERSSVNSIAEAKRYLEAKGVEYIEHTGTTTEEISLETDQLIAEAVDAVFTPTDNTVMAAELSIYKKLAGAKIPHYAGADAFALNGAFLGYGVDYALLGKETADMVKDVLVNWKDPSTMPVRTFDNGTATINTETCKAIGLKYEKIEEALSSYCSDIKQITTAKSFN